jgi:hypothetical protein
MDLDKNIAALAWKKIYTVFDCCFQFIDACILVGIIKTSSFIPPNRIKEVLNKILSITLVLHQILFVHQ